ncbi:putative holin-like toxin [Rossellomorea marisflavi]|jgi:Putative Holin-like Toxin (Hol-Tox)|nr:putative holin-like toxin [Rossellomorea marisflavi]MDR4935368.1 putative holin-like toxin [Rossellomorea marisflavi]MDW4528328.1 putative holin-like toxin [Rossellomorea marisflavi]UKS64905.1 putative holin-like toxin [Rossellomorea marisflavi]
MIAIGDVLHLMIAFGSLIVAIIAVTNEKKK